MNKQSDIKNGITRGTVRPASTTPDRAPRLRSGGLGRSEGRAAKAAVANNPHAGIENAFARKIYSLRLPALFLSCFFFVVLSVFAAEDVLKIGNFSETSPGITIPEKWEPLKLKNVENQTRYEAVREGGQTVVKAESENSASGLVRKTKIDPAEYPWIEWRWKIGNTYEKGDATKKEGDDYPARIYITFEYDPDKMGFFQNAKYKAAKLLYGEYPPHAAINYIWANKLPKGTFVPNPYTDRVMMIAVESGEEHAGVWRTEKRNIAEDYRKAFGENPPPISGVAIMTDSDNTGESAVSYYGDIVMERVGR